MLISCRVNKQCSEGMTPVAFAALKAHLGIVNMLVNGGGGGGTSTTPVDTANTPPSPSQAAAVVADINIANNRGETPLLLATQAGHGRVANLLLSFPGVYVNTANCEGMTALNAAAKAGRTEIASAILFKRQLQANKENKQKVGELITRRFLRSRT